MKKVILATVSTLAMVGAAIAADSTEFGVLTVPSTAEETLVSVPWLDSAATNGAVKVCDLVLTAGLEEMDELQYWDGKKWNPFILIEDGGVKSWQVKSGSSTDANKTLECGRAFLLKRPNTRADHFYIMGKPTSGSKTVELTSGGVYTLIAPTQVDAATIAINDTTKIAWNNLESGGKDFLYVASDNGMKIYRWVNGVWKSSTTLSTDGVIERGKGAWFYSRGSGTNKSVEFK